MSLFICFAFALALLVAVFIQGHATTGLGYVKSVITITITTIASLPRKVTLKVLTSLLFEDLSIKLYVAQDLGNVQVFEP